LGHIWRLGSLNDHPTLWLGGDHLQITLAHAAVEGNFLLIHAIPFRLPGLVGRQLAL
jgi:hypothetical protein